MWGYWIRAHPSSVQLWARPRATLVSSVDGLPSVYGRVLASRRRKSSSQSTELTGEAIQDSRSHRIWKHFEPRSSSSALS
jgi:hypothetical protein